MPSKYPGAVSSPFSSRLWTSTSMGTWAQTPLPSSSSKLPTAMIPNLVLYLVRPCVVCSALSGFLTASQCSHTHMYTRAQACVHAGACVHHARHLVLEGSLCHPVLVHFTLPVRRPAHTSHSPRFRPPPLSPQAGAFRRQATPLYQPHSPIPWAPRIPPDSRVFGRQTENPRADRR